MPAGNVTRIRSLTSVREHLVPVVEAVQILGPDRILFAGKEYSVSPTAGGAQALGCTGSLPANTLQDLLYYQCYVKPLGKQYQSGDRDPQFEQLLSAANKSVSRWDPGWAVYGMTPQGQIAAQKGDRHIALQPGEYAFYGSPGMMLQVGGSVQALIQREAGNLMPGFYFAFSRAPWDQLDGQQMMRFFFNVTWQAAAQLLERVTEDLNRYQIPFRFKCLDDPIRYARADAAVLFISRRDYAITYRIIRGFPSELLGALRSDVPLFSKRILPGVGIAEDPGTGESFGQSRCRQLAAGLELAWQRNQASVEERLAAVAECFEREGLTLDAPHLSPGSVEFEATAKEVGVMI